MSLCWLLGHVWRVFLRARHIHVHLCVCCGRKRLVKP
jgi:hypothetical protein